MTDDDIAPGDLFLATLGDALPEEARVREAATAIAESLDGFTTAEAIMALCFHLHDLLQHAPAESRLEVLAGLIHMIDPPGMSEGHA